MCDKRKREKDSITETKQFYKYETQDLELYFNDMAKQGWLICKIGYNLYTFKKCEPQDLKFFVIVFSKDESYLDSYEKTEDAFIEMYRAYGCCFICSYEKKYVFVSEEDNHAEFKIDYEHKFDVIYGNLFLKAILLFLLPLTFFIDLQNIINPINENIPHIIVYIVIIFFVLSCVYEIISIIIWVIKSKKQIIRGFDVMRIELLPLSISTCYCFSLSVIMQSSKVTAYLSALVFFGIIIKNILNAINLRKWRRDIKVINKAHPHMSQ